MITPSAASRLSSNITLSVGTSLTSYLKHFTFPPSLPPFRVSISFLIIQHTSYFTLFSRTMLGTFGLSHCCILSTEDRAGPKVGKCSIVLY